MGENEAAKLIFHHGLSTAEQVTGLSGRGVGMDVVKSTFEKLGGAIDLETKLNEGTNIIIHLPTTLTIMSSLIVRIEGDRFAVPHLNSRRSYEYAQRMNYRSRRLEVRRFIRLRGSLIPILTMAEITGVNKESDLDQMHQKSDQNACSLFFILEPTNSA